MAPTPTSSVGGSTFKAPPTGPKALRGVSNGTNNHSGESSSTPPSFRHDKVSFAFPQSRQNGSSPISSRFGNGLDARPDPFGGKAPPTGPRGSSNLNGFKPPAPAESSRSSVSSRQKDERRPLSPGYSRPPSPPFPPPPSEPRHASSSRPTSSRPRSPSPTKKKILSPGRRKSTDKDDEMTLFRSKLNIESNRAPISFAIPSGISQPNGKARNLPSTTDRKDQHDRISAFSDGKKGSSSRFDDPPPPPPADLPPSPPPPSPPHISRPSDRPKSPDGPPPPPLADKNRLSSPPRIHQTPTRLDTPPRDPSPPRQSPPRPTFKPISLTAAISATPAIHHLPPRPTPVQSHPTRTLPALPHSLPKRPADLPARPRMPSPPRSSGRNYSPPPRSSSASHWRGSSFRGRRSSYDESSEEEEQVEEKPSYRRPRRSPSPPRGRRSPSPRRARRSPSPQRARRSPSPRPPRNGVDRSRPTTPPPPPPSAMPPPRPDTPPPPPPTKMPSRPATPPSPPAPPKPQWIRPEYIPPPSTQRRSGAGNFVVISDLAKGSKNLIRRFDGEMEGDVVVPVDPRRLSDDKDRGRGTSKNRQGFYEIEYEWNDNSVGTKPPPPPPAVLITELNPLTTVDQITKFLRPYGKIREIDPKMDTKSGMQLGICWVKFDASSTGKKATAHEIAVQVVKSCNGQRIGLSGQEKIKVVLDGRGLRALKAVKEEMAKRYPPKKPVPPPAPPKATAPTPSSGSGTPIVRTPAQAGPSKPIPTGPSNPTLSQTKTFASALPGRPSHFSAPTPYTPPYLANNRSAPPRPHQSILASRPMTLPARPASKAIDSSFIESPFERRPGRYDSYSSRRYRSRSRSRSRTRELSHPLSCTTCGESSSDDDRPRYRASRRTPSPARVRGRGRVMDKVDKKAEEEAVERVRKALEGNGHGYVFIDKTVLPDTAADGQLKEHFRAFRPVDMLSNHLGWYILFGDDTSAARAKVLDGSSFNRHRLVLQVKYPSTKKQENGPTAGHDAKGPKEKSWKFLTITKKNRPTPVKPAKPTVSTLSTTKRGRRLSFSSSSSDDEPIRATRKRSESVSSASSDDEPLVVRPAEKVLEAPSSDIESVIAAQTDEPMLPLEKAEKEPVAAGKKRPAKPKGPKATKKAKIDNDLVDIPMPTEPAVAEIKLDNSTLQATKPVKAPKAPKVAKEPKPKKVAKSELEKFLETGVVEDEEDAYWLGQALAATHEGIEPDLSDAESDDEGGRVGEEHPLFHTAGSWRAEGWKKVPVTAKAEYLPERNRAVVSSEKESGGHASGRTARVTGRRLAHDMETTRKTATTNTAESETLAFNQLSMRKKALRFSRSPIEGYGLYAMETINPGEMVCEYVGEICRSAVAEIREQRYLKQGIGSSYLFRIDSDMVCDATFKGSVSRLINHSCDPSASAKIISINGQSKIVIYAKRMLHPGQEILYDYKFPLESDPALRVPCLCGAPTCRGWLN